MADIMDNPEWPADIKNFKNSTSKLQLPMQTMKRMPVRMA